MPERASPYVGPRPFEREHATLFFGRDREANELISLIISHTEVLLYAQSGAGKSSLVNARLIPLLEAEDFDVLPPARVQGVMEGVDGVEISNIYAFHTLMTWAGRAADPKRFAGMSLADFLQERKCRVDEAGAPVLRIAIFDQFEELFTFYPERWHERRAFFAQVREATKAADPGLRTIFVMREDHVAEVDPYASMLPEKFRIRFRLERMREQGALACIQKPLVSTSRRFAPGVAEALVDQLLRLKLPAANGEPVEAKDQFVELVQLQVVCQSLWDQLRPDDDEIGMDDLASADPGKALLNFYERCVQQTAERTGVREAKIRRWFERALITPAGTRGTVFRAEHDTQGLPNVAVDALEDLHLIRGEVRGRGRWYELTHDRFIESVQISRQHWSEANAATEAARRSLEASAEQWALQGRAKEGLLDEGQLLEAERLLSLPDVERLGVSDTAYALVDRSRMVIDESKRRKEEELRAAKELAAEQQRRAEEQRAAAAQQRRFVKILSAASLVAIGTAIWAVFAQAHAWDAAEKAVDAEKKAVEANERAQTEKARALDLVRFMDTQIGEAFTNIPVQLRERVSDRLEAFYSSQGEPATFEERHRRMGQHLRKALVHLDVIKTYEKGSFSQGTKDLYTENSRKSAMRELDKALRLGKILAAEAPGNREVWRDRILTRFHLAAVSTELGESNVAAEHLNAARKMLDELVKAGPFPLVLYLDWMGLPNLYAAMGDQARKADDVPASRAWYDKALELQKELLERRPDDPERKEELERIKERLEKPDPQE